MEPGACAHEYQPPQGNKENIMSNYTCKSKPST